MQRGGPGCPENPGPGWEAGALPSSARAPRLCSVLKSKSLGCTRAGSPGSLSDGAIPAQEALSPLSACAVVCTCVHTGCHTEGAQVRMPTFDALEHLPRHF